MSVIKQSVLFLFISILVNAGVFYAGIAIPTAFENSIHQQLAPELANTYFAADPEALTKHLCSMNHEKSTNSCTVYEATQFLPYLASFTFVLTLMSLVFVYVLGSISSGNRNTLFKLFRPGLFVAKFTACLIMVLNISLLVFSVFSLEYLLYSKIHYGIMLGALFAALYALGMIIYKSFKRIDLEIDEFGINISRAKHPQIWTFVENIAKKIAAPVPDNIVVGLTSSFYVTQAPVTCAIANKGSNGKLEGRTLCLSLPFCRILSKTELSCVIAHELGHYVGEDTQWSLKFAPLYSRIEETINSMDNDEDLFVILAQAPSRLLMKIFLGAFEKSVKRIKRDRELAADSFSANYFSPLKAAAALVKCHLFSYHWQNIGELHPKYYENLSLAFERLCREFEDFEISEWREILTEHTAHPTDTHPPLSIRLENLGVTFESAFADVQGDFANSSSIDIVDDAPYYEQLISSFLIDQMEISMPEEGWVVLSEALS